MKSSKTKIAIISTLAVLLIAGLVALNHGVMQGSGPAAHAKKVETVTLKNSHSTLPSASGESTTKQSSMATSSTAKGVKDPLYGLPVLTMQNVDINPEKPADMPLADWEEYERQRYEMVQLKAYKFRETDASKVKPIEVSKAVPEAAKKYGVPPDLLAALLYTESDGGAHDAQHDTEGGYGLMMLKESPQCDSLGEAAQLLNISREDLIYNQELNVMGGAAVLRQYYDDALASGVGESEAWYMAVSQYSGRPQPDLAAALADQVGGNLIKGFEIDSDDGSGYYQQNGTQTPIFLPKNWKLAAVDPPAGVAQANDTQSQTPAAPAQ
jgi:hypothetical protein